MEDKDIQRVLREWDKEEQQQVIRDLVFHPTLTNEEKSISLKMLLEEEKGNINGTIQD